MKILNVVLLALIIIFISCSQTANNEKMNAKSVNEGAELEKVKSY